MALLKFKDSNGVWKVLYGALLKNVLRRDKNLSDLPDKDEARKNLGLINNVTTHWHDQYITEENAETKLLELLKGYVKKAGDTMAGALNFANNVWNKVGDDAQIGDRNVAGHICVQGQNGETGIALFQKGSSSNKGTINYDGTKFKLDKPVKITGTTNITGATNISGATTVTGNAKITGTTTMSGNASVDKNLTVSGTIKTTGGFLGEKVPVDDLNNYHQKVNFIYGGHTEGKNDELGKLISTNGWDYAGIVFGKALNKTSGAWGGCIGQLITQGSRGLFFRARDSYSEAKWSPWRQIAYLEDLDGYETDSIALNTSLNKPSYVRFKNGLQICYGRPSKYGDQMISFLKPFKSAPAVVITEQSDNNRSFAVSAVTTTSFKAWMQCDNSDGDSFFWIAIGRWK